MNIKDILDIKLQHTLRYRKKGTYDAYDKSFKLLLTMLSDLSITDMDQFTSASFDNMIDWLKANTEKKNSKINSLMQDFRIALNHSLIADIPFKWTKLTDDTTHHRRLSETELNELRQFIDSLDLTQGNNLMWATMIYLALDTGARKNELMNIRTCDVDLYGNVIYLETTKTTKRRVYIGPLAFPFVKKIFDKNSEYLLFSKYTQKKLSKKSVERFMNRVNNKLQFSSGNLTLHRLRKTFATKLFANGCPLPTISSLLGHSDVRTTMIYLDVDSVIVSQHYKDYYPF